MSKNKKINIIDLFVGCGGLTDGFEKTGKYESLAAIEWDKPCCQTLRKRLGDKWGYKNADEMVMHFDIQRIDELLNGWKDEVFSESKGLRKIIGKNDVDVIVGGPPCQAYSVAGRIRDKNGMKDDYRNYLFESYLKVVKEFRPKFFIFENVPGIFSATPGGELIIDKIIESFRKIGYEISDNLRSVAIVDASEFGVPQARKRVIIFGVDKKVYKDKTKKIIDDFYSVRLPFYKVKNKVSVKEAIFDLPALFPKKGGEKKGEASHEQLVGKKYLNHFPRWHSKRDIGIFKELADDMKKGGKKYGSIEALKELYYKKTGKRSNIHKYNVLKENSPSNTIPAHLYKDGLRHIHPDPKQARSITVREAARLQSFADDFEFLGSMGDQYKMIGNAVPPKLAYAIAESLAGILKDYK